MSAITMDTVRDLIEWHSDHISGNTREFYNGAYGEIADELNSRAGRTCELHDCEGSFSAVNKPVWRCDCGAFMTQYTDATTYHKPRFCPNCGRKVIGG